MKNLSRIRVIDNVLFLKHKAVNFTHSLLPILSVLIIFIIIYQIGFDQNDEDAKLFDTLYSVAHFIFFFGYALRIFSNFIGFKNKKGWIISDVLLLVALSWILIVRYFISLQAPIFNIFISPEFLLFVFVAIFFIETSKASLNLNKKNIEPPLIFAGSFLFLILIGTGLLLLPNATFNGITLIDALLPQQVLFVLQV